VMQPTLAPMKVGLQSLQPDVRSVAREHTASVSASPAANGGRINLSGVLAARRGDSPSLGIFRHTASKLQPMRAVSVTMTRDGLGDLWRLMMIVTGVVLTVGWTAGLSWLLLSLLLLVI
jgi:hypothetical protein